MNEIQTTNQISSLELVKQINIFRSEIEGKTLLEHKDLLKVIRDEFSEEIDEGKISLTSYKDSMNREKPMFNLTLSQAKQVLVRESKSVRKATIKYIEELEANQSHQLPITYKEALIQLVKRVEQNEQLQIENTKKDQIIGELKPKADYMDMLLQNTSLVNINQISKDYGMSAIAMNRLLHELGVQYNQGDQWLLYAKHHAKGYTSSETTKVAKKDGTTKIVMRTKWTQKGRLFIYELLKNKCNLLPIIESEGAS